MLPSGVPGRIELSSDTRGYGRAPLIGWLMLRVKRSCSARGPTYPIMTDVPGATSRCRLTFQPWVIAFRYAGSTVIGDSAPPPTANVNAVSTGTLPVSVNGVPSGGLAVRLATAFTNGCSTVTA